MNSFLTAIENETIHDISLICVIDDVSVPRSFYQAYGGPIAFQIGRKNFILVQTEGKEEISVLEQNPTEWIEAQPGSEYEFVVFSVFELACYRRSVHCMKPSVMSVTVYRHQARDNWSGITFSLDTGGGFGIDTTGTEGLRIFFDNQFAAFEAEFARPMGLRKEKVVFRTG